MSAPSAKSQERFVIYATARTGSNHFVSTLNRSSEITCHYEVFHNNNVFVLGGPKNEAELKLRDADPVGYLERLYQRAPKPIVGFKLFPGHSILVLKKTLADQGIKKVVLYRANRLAQYASMVEAATRGKWAHKSTEKVSKLERLPTFAAEDFGRYLKNTSRYYRTILEALERQRQNYLVIEYTQLFSPSLLANVIIGIGATAIPPLRARKKGNVKTGSQKIVERFSNQDDVLKFLEKHRLQAWALESSEPWPEAFSSAK